MLSLIWGGIHQKITEDHDHKEGGACKRIDQTQGANKENINSRAQNQLSMGGSRSDIFIDHYWLYHDSSYKEAYDLDDGLKPYMTLGSNEYQSHVWYMYALICIKSQ